jgi:hypothetical protein
MGVSTAPLFRTSPHRHWNGILERAAAIVISYSTHVTLRQLFYRLVSAGLLANTQTAYKALSSRTAEARRRSDFPSLIDRTRTIHRHQTFAGATQARHWLTRIYRHDRTEGQPFTIYLGVEKNGIVEQLEERFADFGFPILALGGYSSQTYIDDVVHDVHRQQRPAVLIYAGDFDPSGEDIQRDFVERTRCFSTVRRVALTPEQVGTYALPPQPGKATDARAAKFIERHHQLVQVELDALPPDVLKRLYEDAILDFWDESVYQDALRREMQERANLQLGGAE